MSVLGARRAALVLHRARGIPLLDPIVARDEVRAVTGLISERPDNDARMVLVCFDHPLVAANDSFFPAWLVQQQMIRVGAHVVRLNICLSNHVHSIAVTQIIPERDIRIVTRSNGIDVALLHQFEIANHRLAGDNVSAFRQELVPIDALDVYRFPIKEKLPVSDFHLPKAETEGCYFCDIAI